MRYYTAAVDNAPINDFRDCDNCLAMGSADRVRNLVDSFDIVRGAEWKCRGCGHEFCTLDQE
jgi:hypothetical protein